MRKINIDTANRRGYKFFKVLSKKKKILLVAAAAKDDTGLFRVHDVSGQRFINEKNYIGNISDNGSLAASVAWLCRFYYKNVSRAVEIVGQDKQKCDLLQLKKNAVDKEK